MTTIPLHLSATRPEARAGVHPITVGVPCPRGAVRDDTPAAVRLPSGTLLPVRAKVVDRWSDGSARWWLCAFDAPPTPGATRLDILTDTTASPAAVLDVRVDGEAVRVDTGLASFQFAPGGAFPFGSVDVRTAALMGPGRLEVQRPDGTVGRFRIANTRVEECGPLRASLRVLAAIEQTGVPSASRWPVIEARLDFFAGSSIVRCTVIVRNEEAASHPGGYWELGDPAATLIRDLSIVMPWAASAPDVVHCSPEVDAPPVPMGLPLELYQDSSGGTNWQSRVHTTRDDRVPTTFRGYRVVTAGTVRTGHRATPLMIISSGARRAGVVVRQFWQNFPKAIEVSDAALIIRLFPGQWPESHELQPGEQKAHEFAIDFGGDAQDRYDLDTFRSPVHVAIDPHWVATASAVPDVRPAGDSAYDRLVAAAVEGDDTFVAKREVIDEYGWRNFGDLYADHESVGHQGSTPLVSHYNNQYDVIRGCAVQWLRTGDPRWHELMDDLARHVRDIDVYHTAKDKSAYNGGLFWHTCHYVDAGRSTHRSYPAAPGVSGGGPGAEHNYTTGLMLHYFLTGDRESRETAVALARWVLHMEDGRQTVFRWLSRGATGLASAAGSATYHGPGRGGANSLNALLDGHRLTGDSVFLEHAESLIRRCIHPGDDIEARQLADVERRWSYTVFLQALGRYLRYKREREQTDAMYAYAVRSLLHYARWMARHEYPYLDKPEILEYPNETWAAQDIRKSEVFDHAATYATGEERDRFLERAAFFHSYALTTLERMPTRTLTRPMALLLSNGYMRLAAAAPPVVIPPAAHDDRPPERFVPQKQVALRRAKALVLAAAVTVVAGAAYLLI